MRTLKQLYILLLEKQITKPTGICHNITGIHFEDGISFDKMMLLYSDFRKRHPDFLSKFWWNKHFDRKYKTGYWWTLDEKGQEQRIKFLQHIISKL